jgi:hypothetical protein
MDIDAASITALRDALLPRASHGETMETITDKLFAEDTIVDVDGKTFLRCTFDRCTLRFHGQATFTTVDCRIGVGCSFEVVDDANTVIRQLRYMRSYGGILSGVVDYYLSEGATPSAKLH